MIHRVKLRSGKQRWQEDVIQTLRKYWEIVPGFKTPMIKRKDGVDPIRLWMDDLPKKKKRWSLDQMDINVMSGKLGEGWESIARHLGITEARIGQVRMNYPNDTQNQIFNMLNHWRQKYGNRANLITLLEACHVSGAVIAWEELQTYVDSLEIID
ncbi:hypothetical protein SNE40_022412 [Patella caerulea]|uniref:Death domain-containing protein n=1 Tax=Patella caerulea TaxID=87958 RepID=A0AAN8G5F4_PATCE